MLVSCTYRAPKKLVRRTIVVHLKYKHFYYEEATEIKLYAFPLCFVYFLFTFYCIISSLLFYCFFIKILCSNIYKGHSLFIFSFFVMLLILSGAIVLPRPKYLLRAFFIMWPDIFSSLYFKTEVHNRQEQRNINANFLQPFWIPFHQAVEI